MNSGLSLGRRTWLTGFRGPDSWTIGGPTLAYGGRVLVVLATIDVITENGLMRVTSGDPDVPLTPLEVNMGKHWAATMNCKRRGTWRRGFFGDNRKVRRRTI